jgi:radical SAM protein with 4Fe4S-binding SPASM domain
MDNSEILVQAEHILGKKLRCLVPFEHLMFFPNGDVCTCCPALVNHYTLGNIFKQSFDEIWNGEKSQAFRKSVIDGDFKFCNLNSCLTLKNLKDNSKYNCSDEAWQRALSAEMPKEVHFNIDVACNARCIMCRDKNEFMPEWTRQYEAITESVLIPLLKEAELIYLDGAGEIFASELCKNLLSKVTSTYPKIKINMITNGILASPQNFEKYNLWGHIGSLEVSMHALTRETYNKIVLGGDYDKVMSNLIFLSKLKKSNGFDFFWLNFVVNSYNYHEMVEFQEFANSIGAMVNFWEYRKWGNAKLDERYDEVAIFEPYHKDYKKYLKVIKNKIFDSPNCNINAKLKPLEG